MNIELVARDVVVNEEVHSRVEQKLERIMERTHTETPARVMVENLRGRYVASITLHVKGKEIVAQAEEKNMLQALDLAIDKADRQFKKYQEKVQTKR
jgi:putative sigma-54 modulation protein